MIPSFSLSTLQKKIAWSTMAQYGGKIIQMGLGIIAIKLISNFLSVNGYGVYAKISEYALFFSVAANLGIFANVVRKMADEPNSGKIFINALGLRILTALMFFASGFFIIIFKQSDPVFIIGTGLFLSALLFDYVTSVSDGALQANYLMGRATLALIIGRIVTVGLIWLFIKKWLTINPDLAVGYLFIPALAGSLVTAALSLYFVRQKIALEWKFDGKFMKEILVTSLPFGLINIINSLYFRFLPDYFAGAGLSDEQFATFNVSFRIAQVLSLFSTFLMFSALPGLKEYIDKKDFEKARILYKKISRVLLASGFILVIFGSFMGPSLIALLTHKKYFLPELWFVLPMMLVLAAISYGYDLVLITLFALEQDGWFLKREILALSVSLIFFLSSLLFISASVKLILILGGAVAGESVMVILGIRRISSKTQEPRSK